MAEPYKDDSNFNESSVLYQLSSNLSSFIKQNGWIMVIFIIVCYFMKEYIFHHISSWYKTHTDISNNDEQSTEKRKKFDLEDENTKRMQESRRRMQEQYEKEVKLRLEKNKLEEKKKAEEKLKKANDKDDKSDNSNKKPVKPRTEYNPLSGSGSISSFRPARKMACSRGSCG